MCELGHAESGRSIGLRSDAQNSCSSSPTTPFGIDGAPTARAIRQHVVMVQIAMQQRRVALRGAQYLASCDARARTSAQRHALVAAHPRTGRNPGPSARWSRIPRADRRGPCGRGRIRNGVVALGEHGPSSVSAASGSPGSGGSNRAAPGNLLIRLQQLHGRRTLLRIWPQRPSVRPAPRRP